jgi:branched-chain amino acid transport system permease protein
MLASAAFLWNPEFWIGVALTAAIYGIFATGLQLNIGTTGILNFGQAGFMALGSYTMGLLVVKVGLGLWYAMLLGIPVAVGAALAVGLTSLRLRSDYFAIATLAFAEIVRYVLNYWSDLTGGSLGLSGYGGSWQSLSARASERLESIGLGDHYLLPLALVSFAVLLVSLAGVWALTKTPWGRTLKAIREDEDGARAVGKNTLVYKLQSLSLAAALAAVSGYLLALDLAILTPDSFDATIAIFGVTVIVLGGLDSYKGVLVGALCLEFILDATRFAGVPLADDRVAALRFVIVGVVLILLVAFRPQGLLGRPDAVVRD